MSNFPAAGYVSNSARTEGEMKTALEDWLQATKQIPGGAALTTLTIAAGVVTPTGGIHAVDTEGATSLDDLTNIAQTNLPDGSLISLQSITNSRIVVVKHLAGGTGQIQLQGGKDVVLRDTAQRIILQRGGTQWFELVRSGDHRPQPLSYLAYVSATSITLGAGVIPMWYGATWFPRQIPDAGVTLGNGGLSANTLYYIYATHSGSDVVLEASTTAPTLSDGVQTKTGDATRILVGVVRTNASSQFQSTVQIAGVVSYYSRRRRTVTRYTSAPSTASTSDVAASGGLGVGFILWGDEHATIGVEAVGRTSVAGNTATTSVYLDGVSQRERQATSATNDARVPVSVTQRILGATAYKVVEGKIRVSGGTGTWNDFEEWAEFMG